MKDEEIPVGGTEYRNYTLLQHKRINGKETSWSKEGVRKVGGPVIETPAHKKANLRRRSAAKRAAVGGPLPDELRAWREKNGLSQREASHLFGLSEHAFQKYEAGTAVPSGAGRMLQRLAREMPEVLARLRELAQQPSSDD